MHRWESSKRAYIHLYLDTCRQKQPTIIIGTFITVNISLAKGGLIWAKVVFSCANRKREFEVGRESKKEKRKRKRRGVFKEPDL